ncbi:hypothetical protein ACH5RR_032799 [Cinchona calisaya]|uniref:F-box associated beta-propeller type 3 domain-containing protein n=1 Tax=Cinchona calisaya TaxID=153742 RepID=A0ABD2YJ43_9GENT
MEAKTHQYSNKLKVLIAQILLELPVRSPLKFRCVSKSWLSLISSPQFIESHLVKSSNKDKYTYHKLLSCVLNVSTYDLKSGALQSALNEQSLMATDHVFLQMDYAGDPLKQKSIILVGSCNGLVCIEIDKDVILWNPSTRKTKTLPPLGRHARLYGFVYDTLKDDYIVIGILKTKVKLYKRKIDSWRSIKDNYHYSSYHQSSYLANGNVHWIATLYDVWHWKIVCLDLANETFGEVEWPTKSGSRDWTLGVVGGCLSLFNYTIKTSVDIWIMMEYGVRESWTKVGSVPFSNPRTNFFFSAPVFLSEDGEIMLKFKSRFVLYNPQNNSIRKIIQSGNVRADLK